MRKKTIKFKIMELFHQKTSPVKEDQQKISLSSLKKQAITKEQKDILQRIEQEKISSVREAWIDYFHEKTKHPKYKKSD